MATGSLAIVLTVLGGLSEVVGVYTVVREIAADRARAKTLLTAPREHKPAKRNYPAPLGQHSFGAGGFGGQGAVASIMRPSIEDQITNLAVATGNAMLNMRKDIDSDRDALEASVLIAIDRAYDDVRADLRDVLESDVRLRLVGVAALLAGIALSAAGSVLGNAS